MYSIQALDAFRCNEAIQFVCTEFVSASELHRALNVSVDDYIEYIGDSMSTMISENNSFIAISESDDSIVGCILAGEFQMASDKNVPVPAFIRPLKALLNELEQCYSKKRKIEPGTIMIVDIAIVSAQARGGGIYRRLRESVHARAAERGYQYVIGELSSAVTQRLCVEKMGHKVMCEIEFDSFEYQGQHPFASVRHPASIQLVEGIPG